MSSRARALVIVAAFLFSTGGVAIKSSAFTAIQVAAARSAIAAVVLWLVANRRIRLSWTAILTGAPYAAALALFVASTKLTTGANAIFLQSTAPLFLVVIGRTVLGESVARGELGDLGIMFVGLLGCLVGETAAGASSPNPVLGNVFGLLSGLAFASTLAGLRWLAVKHPSSNPLDTMVVGNVLVAAGLLPWAWPYPSGDLAGWSTLVYLGAIQIGVAYLALTRAIRHLPAFEVSLLLLVEPVLNPLWTWLLRGERPSAVALAGGSCILAACIRRTWWARRQPAPTENASFSS